MTIAPKGQPTPARSSWVYPCLMIAALIGGLEIYKHSTWSEPVDVELKGGAQIHGRIRWGWRDELHIKTDAGETVTTGWAIIKFPIPRGNATKA